MFILRLRPTWKNLNGLWQYAITQKTPEIKSAALDGSILVPIAGESFLSGFADLF